MHCSSRRGIIFEKFFLLVNIMLGRLSRAEEKQPRFQPRVNEFHQLLGRKIQQDADVGPKQGE